MRFAKKQPRQRTTSETVPTRFELEACESRQLLSTTHVALPNLTISAAKTTSTTVSGYSPAQISAAYGFSSLKDNGAGQTIAIVDAYSDPNIASDLAVFDKQFGLAAANLQVVSQTGGSAAKVQADSGWASEISLDVEWAHAIAPGAKILLVETSSDSEANLMAGVKYARSAAGVSVVSMSWGESEYSGETAYDSYFTTPSGHTGVTFVSASGDEGPGAEFPSSSPNVLSVGGTTLDLSSTGAITSETGWQDSSGGASRYEKSPSYQTTASGSTSRTTPDVSYDANPDTGFAVYDSYRGGGGWSVVGGTSAGAPQWAALIAIADQARVAAGKGTLDGASQTLPTLYSLYASPTSASYSTYTADFNDISSGGGQTRGGGFGRGFGGGFGGGGFGRGFATTTVGGAAAGYDTTTGLGSPKAGAIVQALTGAVSTAVKTVSKSNVTAGKKTVAAKDVVAPQGTTDLSAVTHAIDDIPFAAGNSFASTYLLQATTASKAVSPGAFSAVNSNVAIASPVADGVLQRLNATMMGDVVQTTGLAAVDATILMGNLPTVGSQTVELVKTAAAMATLHFPHFDPAVVFDDVMGAFVNESTALAFVSSADAQTWAWGVTAAVIGIDAILLGRWMSRKRPVSQRQRAVERSLLTLQPIEA